MKWFLVFVAALATTVLLSSCCGYVPERESIYYPTEEGERTVTPDYSSEDTSSYPTTAEEALQKEGEFVLDLGTIASTIEGQGDDAIRKYDFALCDYNEPENGIYGVVAVDDKCRRLNIKLQSERFTVTGIRWNENTYLPASEADMSIDISFDNTFGSVSRFVLPVEAEGGDLVFVWQR